METASDFSESTAFGRWIQEDANLIMSWGSEFQFHFDNRLNEPCCKTECHAVSVP